MNTWNKGERVGQKKAFKLEDIWLIRIRLEIEKELEQLVLFTPAIDSKLRSCDLLSIKVRDLSSSGLIQTRAVIEQQITRREVQFEITSRTVQCLTHWIQDNKLVPNR